MLMVIMRKKHFFGLLAVGIMILSSLSTLGQNNGCTNLNFDQANFNNWIGYTGNYNSCCPTTGIVPGRHTIITNATIDPNTCGGLSTLPPGVPYAARLGNDMTGAQAERLRYNLNVDVSNNLFVYRYAVVLEDPSHSPSDQPKFDLRILDANGNVVDPICGQYSVTSAPGLPGWNTCGQTIWRDWTTVGLDLTSFLGQQITVEFTTYDCDLGGHFGYAYIAASCGSSIIDIQYCIGDTSVLLTAPDGFAGYAWSTGATTQSTVVQNPVIGANYDVTMTAVNGCASQLYTTISPTVMNPGFLLLDTCMNNAMFLDQTTTSRGTIADWTWDFGDGSPPVVGIPDPIHAYSAPGTYTITLIPETSDGCRDTLIQNIDVVESPVADFQASISCTNRPINFNNNSGYSGGGLQYSWDFGDGNTSTDTDPIHSFSSAGTYDVELIVSSTNTACADTILQSFTVTEAPVPTFNPLPTLCESDAAIDLAPYASASQTGISTFGGTAVSGTFFDPNLSGPGTFTLDYTIVSDVNGCDSTIQQTITIEPDPQPTFQVLPTLCIDGGALDLSPYVDPGIANPNYTLTGNGVSNDVFDPAVAGVGTHVLTYAVENGNTGCAKTVLDSIVVSDLPVINLPDEVGVCFNYRPFQLSFGTPVGGNYISPVLGPGALFDPTDLPIDSYTITYEYISPDNCRNEEDFIVRIEKDLCFCNVYLPNAFTPNADFVNDYFFAKSSCSFSYFDLKIYNRWGEMVFQALDPFTSWDGTFNGEDAPTGVYLYTLDYIGNYYTDFLSPNSKREELRGTVTLIR